MSGTKWMAAVVVVVLVSFSWAMQDREHTAKEERTQLRSYDVRHLIISLPNFVHDAPRQLPPPTPEPVPEGEFTCASCFSGYDDGGRSERVQNVMTHIMEHVGKAEDWEYYGGEYSMVEHNGTLFIDVPEQMHEQVVAVLDQIKPPPTLNIELFVLRPNADTVAKLPGLSLNGAQTKELLRKVRSGSAELLGTLRLLSHSGSRAWTTIQDTQIVCTLDIEAAYDTRAEQTTAVIRLDFTSLRQDVNAHEVRTTVTIPKDGAVVLGGRITSDESKEIFLVLRISPKA